MDIWNITITSPLGDTAAKLHIDDAGADPTRAITGKMTGKGGDGPIGAGRIDGNQMSWTCRIEKPMPMTLTFKGTRRDGEMVGKVKFGIFASGQFVATRATVSGQG